jgi:hypothetical protein
MKLIHIITFLIVILIIPVFGLSNVHNSTIPSTVNVSPLKAKALGLPQEVVSPASRSHVFTFPIESKAEGTNTPKTPQTNVVIPSQFSGLHNTIGAGLINPESWKHWGTEYMLLATGVIGFFVVRRRYEVPKDRLPKTS